MPSSSRDQPSTDLVLADVGACTIALAGAALANDDAWLRSPSRLPGWSRGHVLSHVINNAEGLTQVLLAAADGRVASMYPSQESRDAEIEAGADRGARESVLLLLGSAARWTAAWAALPQERLETPFTGPAGWFRPVGDIPWLRWREVVLHDLDVGYDPPTRTPISPALVERLVEETAAAFSRRAGLGSITVRATDTGRSWRVGDGASTQEPTGSAVEVSGTTEALAWWLTGRGSDAVVSSSGVLPALPAWL